MIKEQPNLDYIEQLSGDDQEFKQGFLTILKEEFPIEHREYLDSVASGIAEQTALIVHKLKHKLNILSLYKSYELAIDYEKALHTGDFGLHSEFTSVLDQVDTYLKTI